MENAKTVEWLTAVVARKVFGYLVPLKSAAIQLLHSNGGPVLQAALKQNIISGMNCVAC